MSSKARTKSIVGSIVGVGVVGLVVAGLTIPSGATFNDEDTARLDIVTATVVLGVSDADNSGTIDLDFNNLKPGQVIEQTFNVRNDGTIPATANLGSSLTNLVAPSNNVVLSQLNYLRVGVWETSAGQSVGLAPVSSLPATGFNLGVLQPGETKTFTFAVKLDNAAGNDWQGVTFGGNLPVTLTQ